MQRDGRSHSVGVIHRDLKPSNLFVTTVGKLKVLDFGISKLENDKDSRVTATQTVVGTPLYMSPEQVRSAKHVDARSDIWSLGIILYELLTGRTPFEGSTTAAAVAICVDAPPPISQFRAEVPPNLARVVMRALQKEPSLRFASVQALAVALAPFGSGAVPAVDVPSARASESGQLLQAVESAPTVHVDRSPADLATAPGWTTRSRATARRTRTGVIVVASVIALGVVVAVAVRISSTKTTSSSSVSAVPDATTAKLGTETVVAPVVSLSLPTPIEATSAPPPTAAVTVRAPAHVPTISTATPTTAATASHARPAPTRL